MSTTQKPHVAAVIQARMGSSRLPGKVLKDIGGRSAIAHLLQRLRRCTTLDSLVIATSTAPGDDALEAAVAELAKDQSGPQVRVFRGSESDVLARFAGAAPDADVVVRLTGDCPLISGEEVDRVVGEFIRRRAAGEPLDFLRNQRGHTRRIPHGLDTEVMTQDVLQRSHKEASAPGEREHVTPWLYGGRADVRIDHTDPPGPDLSHLRLTVDTPADLMVMRAVVAALGPDADAASACAWLEQHPEVMALQQGVQQRGTASAEELRARAVTGQHLLARVDAGDGIGFGHMARVEAIASAWIDAGGRVTLLGWGLGGPVASRLSAIGAEFRALSAPAAIAGKGGPDDVADACQADAQRTIAIATELNATLVLVDGYPFRQPWQQTVAAALPLAAIDDLAAFGQEADVVINQNVGFDGTRYVMAPSRTDRACQVLAGAPFVLLRPSLRAPRVATDELPRVLVNFGGADLGGWTLPVTRALLTKLPEGVQIDVLLGSGASSETAAELTALAEALAEEEEEVAAVAAVAATAATTPKRLTVHRSLAHVAQWMDGATLAVCAAGSTCWELLARDVVPVAVPLADNQRVVAAGLSDSGAGRVPGWHADISADDLAAAAAELLADASALTEMRRSGARLIDGRGVFRVVDAMVQAVANRATAAAKAEP
ncbi:MAG: hypothetical protein KC502_17145 [Myxococcales bacterium]|nr:hypothetical protein [Myxococcales bacterium]